MAGIRLSGPFDQIRNLAIRIPGAGLVGFAVVATLAWVGWALTEQATKAPTVPTRMGTGYIYVLTQGPEGGGEAVEFRVAVLPNGDFRLILNRGDEAAVVLVGDTRLRTSTADDPVGVQAEDFFEGDHDCTGARAVDVAQDSNPRNDCRLPTQVLYLRVPPADPNRPLPTIDATPVGRWSDAAAGTRLVRTPHVSLGRPTFLALWGAAADAVPEDHFRLRGYAKPASGSSLRVAAFVRPDEEATTAAPDRQRELSEYGYEWKLPRTGSLKHVVSSGYARFVSSQA